MTPSPLVDAHTHLFSRTYFEALASQSPQPGSVRDRLDRLSARTGIEVPEPGLEPHVRRWLDALDAAGVAHAVTFASVAQEAPAVADAVRLAAGRLTGFAVLDPHSGIAEEVARRHFTDRGFRGLVYFPALHQFRPNDQVSRAVLEVVQEFQALVVVHFGLLQIKVREALGLPRPFDHTYANPLDLIPAADAFPDVTFVIPHFGAGLFRECLMVGALCPNVVVDTSSSNGWMVTQPQAQSLREVFQRVLAVFGPERVLFGTDSCTFPRGWRADVHAAQVEALEAAGASASDRDLIFGGNAARLLGLAPAPAATPPAA